MSRYATIAGHIQYNSTHSLEVAVIALQQGGWLTASETWIDEDGTVTHHPTTDGEQRRLIIPGDLYRNLARHIETLTDGAIDGYLIETSIDGAFTLRRHHPGDPDTPTEAFDPHEFADEHNIPTLGANPTQDRIATFQRDVLQVFHDHYEVCPEDYDRFCQPEPVPI